MVSFVPDIVLAFHVYLLPLVVAFVIHFLGHSEVSNFDNAVVGQQNIARCQIAVENLERFSCRINNEPPSLTATYYDCHENYSKGHLHFC